jgi:Tfp pilus assembly protein PilF
MASTRITHGIAIGVFAALLATVAAPAFGQGKGSAKGRILDDKGKPIVGAQVTLKSATDQTARPVLQLSDAQGQWSADGLSPGQWTIEAVKSNLGGKTKVPVAVTDGATVDAGDLKLAVVPTKAAPPTPPSRGGGGARGNAKEPAPDPAKLKDAKRAELDAKFKSADDAVAAGRFDDAIAQIMAVSAEVTSCNSCFSKIGDVYIAKSAAATSEDQKKADIATGEKYYKQAIEIEPGNPDPYAALASLYNQLHRLEEATQMSTKATELAAASGAGGNADALYNQGVILWNQQKAPEAQAALEKAVAADPKMADAQYLLGMVLINQGKMAEAKKPFLEYMKLEPKGAHAVEVKAMLDVIK